MWALTLENLDDETREAYSRAVRFFCEFNGFDSLATALEQGGEQHVANFVKALRDRKLASMTIRLYVTAVKRFLSLRGGSGNGYGFGATYLSASTNLSPMTAVFGSFSRPCWLWLASSARLLQSRR